MVRGTQVDLSKVKRAKRAREDTAGEQSEKRAPADDGGVAHGALLLAFTDAVMADDRAAIERSRDALADQIGPAGIVDTAAVIAMFNIVDRVADATGIPIDTASREFRYGVGEELGMSHLTPELRAG